VPAGIQIGQLLVEQGVLTSRQVEHILRVQKMSHRPFGDLAERLYGISPQAVEDAWVQQYIRMVGTVDLDDQKFDEQCLRLLNRRQAWQFHMLPMNRGEENLNIATSADDLVRAVNFSAKKLDEPIYFQIAERKQLTDFLMKHYPVPEYIAKFAESMK
jgi:type II secretion system (T2SS) protein E